MTSTDGRPVSELERAVAAELRAHVAARKVKKAALAEAVGVHRTHMSRLLNGHTHIDLNQLAAICAVLKIRVVDVVDAAVESLPARDALMEQLDGQAPPVQADSDDVRAADSDPNVA